MNVIAYLRR